MEKQIMTVVYEIESKPVEEDKVKVFTQSVDLNSAYSNSLLVTYAFFEVLKKSGKLEYQDNFNFKESFAYIVQQEFINRQDILNIKPVIFKLNYSYILDIISKKEDFYKTKLNLEETKPVNFFKHDNTTNFDIYMCMLSNLAELYASIMVKQEEEITDDTIIKYVDFTDYQLEELIKAYPFIYENLISVFEKAVEISD